MVQTISFPGQGELKYRTLLLPLAHSQLMMGPISLSPSIFWLPSKGRCTSSGAMLYLIFMNYFISTDIKTFTQVLQKTKKKKKQCSQKNIFLKTCLPLCVCSRLLYLLYNQKVKSLMSHDNLNYVKEMIFFSPHGLSNNIISKVIVVLFKMMSKKNKWNCLT